jgi:hypothetical protein
MVVSRTVTCGPGRDADGHWIDKAERLTLASEKVRQALQPSGSHRK